MIDISQWRANIGLWHCYRIPAATNKSLPHGTTVDTWVESLWPRESGNDGDDNLTFSLVLFFLLLLILSGDVELNPGPKTGKHITFSFDSHLTSMINRIKF